MSFDLAPMIGIFLYFMLGDFLIRVVSVNKLDPNKAFWLGFWVPVTVIFSISVFSFLYRQFNEIYYEQEYVGMLLSGTSLILGCIKGNELRNIAIENSGPDITPEQRVRKHSATKNT